MWLIYLSTFANFCSFICIMLNKILDNPNWNFWSDLINGVTQQESSIARLATTASNYSLGVTTVIEITCFLDYLNWRFFRVIWLVPYLFRIVRLNQIWNCHKMIIKAEDEVVIETEDSRATVRYDEQQNRIEQENRRKKCQTYFI
jgi:hypothetical protein